jgi:hypothetical protein
MLLLPTCSWQLSCDWQPWRLSSHACKTCDHAFQMCYFKILGPFLWGTGELLELSWKILKEKGCLPFTI